MEAQVSEAPTSETDIKPLFDHFYEAYQALRDEWLKTGGGMDMELRIRDASAEATYLRRSEAAKRGGAKRRARRG
jgi:hypothetical protein